MTCIITYCNYDSIKTTKHAKYDFSLRHIRGMLGMVAKKTMKKQVYIHSLIKVIIFNEISLIILISLFQKCTTFLNVEAMSGTNEQTR